MAKKKTSKSTHKVSVGPRITPFLWFDNQAEEAARFYTALFSEIWGPQETKVLGVQRYGDAGPGPAGSVLIANFLLEGQEFVALNGGPQFKFTEAISFVINCKNQEEVDHFWYKLTAGGEESMCGWLKDKFGLSWQVVPTALTEMLGDKNTEKAKRAMEAMLTMKKIDIEVMRKAFEGN